MARRISDKLAKIWMMLINGIFLGCGFVIVVLGCLTVQYSFPLRNILYNLSAANAVFIALGVTICAISFLGFFGACKENLNVLKAFVVTMVIIQIVQLGVGVYALVNRDELAKIAKKEARTWVNSTDEFIKQARDNFQRWLSCCGAEGPADYTGNKPYPKSCCNLAAGDKRQCTNPNKKGCIQVIKDQIIVLGGVAIAITLLQVIGLNVACWLCKSIVDKAKRPEQFHLNESVYPETFRRHESH